MPAQRASSGLAALHSAKAGAYWRSFSACVGGGVTGVVMLGYLELVDAAPVGSRSEQDNRDSDQAAAVIGQTCAARSCAERPSSGRGYLGQRRRRSRASFA